MQIPTIHHNLLSQAQCQQLIDYLHTPDERYDARPDITSKHPIWNESEWPQHIVKQALDKILPGNYVIDDVTLMDSKIGLKPHADWIGDYHTVLFALDIDPVAHTVFFKNYITERPSETHPAAFISKMPWSPFQYELEDKYGQVCKIEDIRELLQQCKQNPKSVQNFVVDQNFINMLNQLVIKRSQINTDPKKQNDKTGYVQPTPRIGDYEKWVKNYKSDQKFSKLLHKEYLEHVPIEDLHGLTIDRIIEWKIGSVIHFDSTQIHSASSTHRKKTFISIFLHFEDR